MIFYKLRDEAEKILANKRLLIRVKLYNKSSIKKSFIITFKNHEVKTIIGIYFSCCSSVQLVS
jgi:hypothetical protein